MYLDSLSTSPRWLGFMWTHRGPLLAAHPLSLWKITNTHKVRMEPSQPPTEPIWSSLKHSNYLPPVCLRVWLQHFHYLFEQIGLRLVCGGLIVTRDERLQRARSLGLLPSRSAVSSSWPICRVGSRRPRLHSSRTAKHWCVDVCHLCSAALPQLIDGEMCRLVGEYHFWENICL